MALPAHTQYAQVSDERLRRLSFGWLTVALDDLRTEAARATTMDVYAPIRVQIERMRAEIARRYATGGVR